MATYLYRTFSTATNRKIWTWSGWVKRTNLVSDHTNALFGAYYDGSNRSVIRFNGHRLQFQDSANSVDVLTTRLFRDPNAWYHIVARVDTTQSTASDRIRFYVNGVQETAFDTSNYPGQNINMEFQGAVVHYINARRNGSGTVDSIASMVYSHVHFADGQSLAPTVFGETDSTTGEWKINTSPSFTLGTNGFTILKDGNTFTDQSSNSNNWTQAGSTGLISKTEDNPSNVFATWNPLHHSTQSFSNVVLKNGNTTFDNNETGSAVYPQGYSTLAASSGKYYFESKLIASSSDASMIGISGAVTTEAYVGNDAYTYVFRSNGTTRNNDNSAGTYTGWGVGDIVQVAVDLDNNKLYFGINGTWQNSGDPTSGSTGTGAIFTITAPSSTPHGVYHFTLGDTSSAGSFEHATNFGNGYFGTTAVSSAGTNASNIGIFEYDVPTGYTALSTKGLNE
jgi:hypothetical protein